MNKFSAAELEEFWDTYIGNRDSICSSAISQMFVRGPYAGHSIREMMEIAIAELGKKRPDIKYDNYN